MLYQAGQHHVGVSDDYRQASSNIVTIRDVFFRATFTPEHAYINDPTLSLTIEVLDEQGRRVPEYLGSIDLNPSVEMRGLPQSIFQATPDFTFTAADQGWRRFDNLAFTLGGSQTLIMSDRNNPERSSTSNSASISIPPLPQPIPFAPMPITPWVAYTTAMALPTLPPPITPGWVKPYRAQMSYTGPNWWGGFPSQAIPAKQGSLALTMGVSQRGPLEWFAGTFYICAFTGWEKTLTSQRLTGPSLQVPWDDPTFGTASQGSYGCSGYSEMWNGGALTYLPAMIAVATTNDVRGSHVNVRPSGNAGGAFLVAINGGGDTCEAESTGDPIDTRSGAFFLHEVDLGTATGCTDVGLSFERTYNSTIGTQSALSPGWVHNYEQNIRVINEYAVVQRSNGSYLFFKDVGGPIYAGPPGAKYILVKRDGGGWGLIYRTRRVDIFDAAGRLIAEQDPAGNLIWMTYEHYTRNGQSGTRLARVDAPGGRFLWFGYDYYRPQRLQLVGDHSGRVVRYGYDDTKPYDYTNTGKLISVTDAMSQTATYHYTDPWLLAEKYDALGTQVFSNTYNLDGQVMHQINSRGEDLHLSYAVITDTAIIQNRVGSSEASQLSALLETTVVDQLGAQARYTYGDDGLLRLKTDPAGATTRYRGYTTTRKASEIEDALGHVTQYQYNDLGLPTQVTNALGQSTHYSYDGWGQPTSMTDAAGHSTTLSYSLGQIASVTNAAGETTSFTYADQAGWKDKLTQLTEPGNLTTTFSYNTAGDVSTVTDTLGRSTSITYDDLGRPQTIRDPQGITTTISFDPQDRLTNITQTAPANAPNTPIRQRTTSFGYDAGGHLIRVTDPLSRTIRYQYDSAGRMTHQILPDQRVITLTVNLTQHQTTLEPPGRPPHTMRFSPTSLVESYLPPTIGLGEQRSESRYDLLGQLIGLTRPDGSMMSLGYDAIGRTTTMTTTDGLTQLAYSPSTGALQTVSSADGRTLAYDYDAAGRVGTTRWTGLVSGTVTLTPTLLGRVAGQQVMGQPAIRFAYDHAGQLTQAGAIQIHTDPTTARLLGSDLGVVGDTWGYNGFSEPVHYASIISATTAFSTTYERDATGRITKLTETLTGSTTGYSYSYDLSGQLTEVWQAGSRIARYTYDRNGNRVSMTGPQDTVIGVYDAQDRLLQYGATSYTYTLNGEQASATTNGQTTSYAYDPSGQLRHVSLPDGTQVQYVLDAAGRRIGKQVNGTLVQGFLYQDELRPIAELDGAGNVVSQFVYATRLNVPDYLIKNGRSYQIISDHVGSPRMVVDTETGAIVQQISYDTFGIVLQDTHPGFQPFGFAGGLYDQHSQLTHFGAREYDASTGRWTSKDPLIFGGGDTNLYRYVGNDPVNAVDPTGTFGILGAAIVGFVAGVVTDYIAQYSQYKDCIDWKELLLAGIVGGLGGLAGGAISGLIRGQGLKFMLVRAAMNALYGAGLSAAGTTVMGSLHGQQVSQQAQFDSAKVGAMFGAVGSFAGDTASGLGNSFQSWNYARNLSKLSAGASTSAQGIGENTGKATYGRVVGIHSITLGAADGAGIGLSNGGNIASPYTSNCGCTRP